MKCAGASGKILSSGVVCVQLAQHSLGLPRPQARAAQFQQEADALRRERALGESQSDARLRAVQQGVRAGPSGSRRRTGAQLWAHAAPQSGLAAPAASHPTLSRLHP
jgi:hypothetical protein